MTQTIIMGNFIVTAFDWVGAQPFIVQLFVAIGYLLFMGLISFILWYSGAGFQILGGVGSGFIWVFEKLGLKKKEQAQKHKTRVLEKIKY